MAYKVKNLNGVLQQEYEADPRLMQALMAQQQGSSTAPVGSALEGIARMLQGGVGGYFGGELKREYQDKQKDQYSAIADILAPATSSNLGFDYGGGMDAAGMPAPVNVSPTTTMQDNPNRAKLMAALEGGLVSPSSFGEPIMDSLGFGKGAEPIKLGANDRLIDPKTHKQLVGAAQNPNEPFLGMDESGQPIPNPAFMAYEIAKANAGRSSTSITVQGTPGEDARDRATGQQIAEFVDAGGYADAQKNIAQLNGVISELKTGKNLTGPVLGNIPQQVRAMTHPESVDAEERVQEVVQRNLRVILGAQFTQREGEQLISRAYNPRLPETTNAARLEKLSAAMQKAYDAKVKAAEYFHQNRSMRGYNGPKLWSRSDIEAAAGLSPSNNSNNNATKKPSVSNW